MWNSEKFIIMPMVWVNWSSGSLTLQTVKFHNINKSNKINNIQKQEIVRVERFFLSQFEMKKQLQVLNMCNDCVWASTLIDILFETLEIINAIALLLGENTHNVSCSSDNSRTK